MPGSLLVERARCLASAIVRRTTVAGGVATGSPRTAALTAPPFVGRDWAARRETVRAARQTRDNTSGTSTRWRGGAMENFLIRGLMPELGRLSYLLQL